MDKRKQLVAAAGLVVGMVVIAGFFDPFSISRRPGIGFDTSSAARHVEGVAIALAAIGAWTLTPRRVDALVGLGLAVGLAAIGFLWPLSALAATAATFALPLTATMLIRCAVNLTREQALQVPGEDQHPQLAR